MTQGPARPTPQDRIPIYRWGAQEAMVKELLGERWFVSGLWIPNTVQPTWELGRRWGVGRTISGNLNIQSGNAFLPGPADNKRWYLLAVWREGTTAATRIILRPKDATDTAARLTVSSTSEQAETYSWPGIPVDNDNVTFGGGSVGLEVSGDAGDTSRGIRLLVYETDM